jgi:two-component system chemotaxis response regulator CheY
MRVLIADDQKSFGTVLADMVRYCGHEVVAIVGSGLEAIHAFTLHKPDLVLMDYRMPKLNGATACRHILAKDPTARIVLLSAWSPLDGADQSGAMCFLSKPVDLARLNATLLTISQSIRALESPVLEGFDSTPPPPVEARRANTIVPFVPIPIPQEIISPIEHFPIPSVVETPDVDQRNSLVAGGASSADEKSLRKTRPSRARKKVRRVR